MPYRFDVGDIVRDKNTGASGRVTSTYLDTNECRMVNFRPWNASRFVPARGKDLTPVTRCENEIKNCFQSPAASDRHGLWLCRKCFGDLDRKIG